MHIKFILGLLVLTASCMSALATDVENGSGVCVIGCEQVGEQYNGCLVKSCSTGWSGEERIGPFSFDFDTGIQKYSFIGKDPLVYTYGSGSGGYLGNYEKRGINLFGIGFIDIEQYDREVNASSIEKVLAQWPYLLKEITHQTIDGRPGYRFLGPEADACAWYLLDNRTIVKIDFSQDCFYTPKSVCESIFDNTIKTIHIQRIHVE
jgi:hypothetical protein